MGVLFSSRAGNLINILQLNTSGDCIESRYFMPTATVRVRSSDKRLLVAAAAERWDGDRWRSWDWPSRRKRRAAIVRNDEDDDRWRNAILACRGTCCWNRSRRPRELVFTVRVLLRRHQQRFLAPGCSCHCRLSRGHKCDATTVRFQGQTLRAKYRVTIGIDRQVHRKPTACQMSPTFGLIVSTSHGFGRKFKQKFKRKTLRPVQEIEYSLPHTHFQLSERSALQFVPKFFAFALAPKEATRESNGHFKSSTCIVVSFIYAEKRARPLAKYTGVCTRPKSDGVQSKSQLNTLVRTRLAAHLAGRHEYVAQSKMQGWKLRHVASVDSQNHIYCNWRHFTLSYAQLRCISLLFNLF